MKAATLIISAWLALSAGALAQESATVQANAASRSQTSVSADRGNTRLSHDGDSSAGVATEHGSANLAGGTELNAALTKRVDARRAKPGDEVRATVTDDIESNGQIVIRKGSTLVGRVTSAKPHGRASGSAEGSTESHLGIVFDKAVLKDGREVPVNATIQALASAQSNASAELSDAGSGFGRARSSGGSTRAAGGGLVGGGGLAGGGLVGGGLGGGGGLVGGVGAAVGGAGAVAGGVTGAASAAARASSRVAAGALSTSAGAVGSLNAAGQLTSGSKGVFGMRDVNIASATAGSAQGSLITSASRNVRLDGGTRMLLVTGASAGAR